MILEAFAGGTDKNYFMIQQFPLKVRDAYVDNDVTQDVTFLIDGDANTRYNPSFPAQKMIFTPVDTVFELEDYKPAKVRYFTFLDAHGSGYQTKFILVRADTGEEVEVFTFTGEKWMQEVRVDVKEIFEASHLIIRAPNGGDCYPNWFKMFGEFTLAPEKVFPKKAVPLKNMMLVNAHPWDIDPVKYPAKFQAVKDAGVFGVRLYSDSYADKDINGNYALNPELRGFEIDTAFKKFKEEIPGFVCHVCYQNQSLQVRKTWEAVGKVSHLNFSYQFNDKREEPGSHLEVAKDLFVLASRGGKNASVPNYPVYVSPNAWDVKNIMVKGGGFYDILEGGNEWNAWWKGYDGFMNGKQLGPAHSAWYDGHKGQFPEHGAKTADPSIQLSSNGLASDKPDIFRGLVAWAEKHRGDIPFDIMQFHCYSSIGGQYSAAAGGLPPELGMMPQVKNMVYWANRWGKKVMIGEWGWDTDPGSPLNAPAFGNYTADQTRANWVIRGMLSFAEAGIDYAEYYRLYQEPTMYPQVQFNTMSLLEQVDKDALVIKRRLVGDYWKQFGEFGNFVFDRRENENVVVFKNGTQEVYCLWAVEQMTVVDKKPTFTEVKGTWTSGIKGTVLRFKDDGSGEFLREPFTGSIEYNAKPVFILVDGGDEPETPTPTYTGRKGYWVLEGKRVYYAVYKSSDGVYSIKTGNYTWYKSI
jgi:hypothetical protein